MRTPLLAVRLSVSYPGKPQVLTDVAFDLAHGEVLGLVGPSGSGKSTLGLAILRLLDQKRARLGGSIRLESADLLGITDREMRRLRGARIGFVPQNPLASLNPALRLGTQLREAWHAHASGDQAAVTRQLFSALAAASLPATPEFLALYPRQLSVGMAQRVLIAMASLHRPPLLIADEPTSALDVITQAEILQLFGRLNQDNGTALLYISHDLLSVANLCHRVAILYQGTIVETGPTEQIFTAPQHPYTQQLVASIPRLRF